MCYAIVYPKWNMENYIKSDKFLIRAVIPHYSLPLFIRNLMETFPFSKEPIVIQGHGWTITAVHTDSKLTVNIRL